MMTVILIMKQVFIIYGDILLLDILVQKRICSLFALSLGGRLYPSACASYCSRIKQTTPPQLRADL